MKEKCTVTVEDENNKKVIFDIITQGESIEFKVKFEPALKKEDNNKELYINVASKLLDIFRGN